MSQQFNYRHLYYFWVVAKEGSLTRAAARLDMAVQTISAQVHELERALGHALLRPAGRGLVLTPAGQAALQQAEQIFALGEVLPQAVQEAATAPVLRLNVGVSDGLPKLVVHRFLAPVVATPHLYLKVVERDFATLLAELALHRLDLVYADRPAPPNPNLRVYSHSLGHSPLRWYAPPAWAQAAQAGFPGSLAQVPVLLPTHHAAVRGRLDAGFERLGLRPQVVAEFEDSAQLKTFGAAGLGVFPAPALVHDDLLARYGVQHVGDGLGPSLAVDEEFYAFRAEKKIQHPLVRQLLAG